MNNAELFKNVLYAEATFGYVDPSQKSVTHQSNQSINQSVSQSVSQSVNQTKDAKDEHLLFD